MNITEQFDGLPSRTPGSGISYPAMRDMEAYKELLAVFFNEHPEAWTQFYAWREAHEAARPMTPVVTQHNIK
jgi:hypothetical protein